MKNYSFNYISVNYLGIQHLNVKKRRKLKQMNKIVFISLIKIENERKRRKKRGLNKKVTFRYFKFNCGSKHIISG